MFTGGGNRIFVDAVTGQVTAVFYQLSPPGGEKIDFKTAETRAKDWLAQREVSLVGWILEESKVYDRGSAGKEYVFQWIKRSSKGVKLPCITKVAMGEGGEIRSFWCVERQTEVALEPSIKAAEAVEKARKVTELASAQVARQELKVWFDNKGKLQLWWVLELRDGGTERKAILDAHTGVVLLALQHGESSTDKATVGKVEKKVEGVLKDLKQVVKVGILARGSAVGGGFSSPTQKAGAQVIGVIDKQKNKDTFRELMSAMETTLHQESNVLALLSPLWLRLYLQDGQWIYHCKFSPKDGYLEVFTKEPWPQKTYE